MGAGEGFLLGLLGYLEIFMNKEQKGKPHLTSWHSRLGLTLLVL